MEITNYYSTSCIEYESTIPGSDPSKWNLNLDKINFLLANPPKQDITIFRNKKNDW